MTQPIKNIISEFTSYKVLIAIACGIALSLAILTFFNRITTPNKNNPYFSYGTSDNLNGPIHVIDNKRVDVRIVFDIGPGVSEVSLAFSGEHGEIPGLTMTDNTVVVVNGKAISKVIIQFDSKPTLKAGTHFFEVVARDMATDKIIRRGEIKFTYNIHEVIAKCSCWTDWEELIVNTVAKHFYLYMS